MGEEVVDWDQEALCGEEVRKEVGQEGMGGGSNVLWESDRSW